MNNRIIEILVTFFFLRIASAAVLGSLDDDAQQSEKQPEQAATSQQPEQTAYSQQETTGSYVAAAVETATTSATTSETNHVTSQASVWAETSATNTVSVASTLATSTRNYDEPITILTTTNSAGETYTSKIWWLPSSSLTETGSTTASLSQSASSASSTQTTAYVNSTNGGAINMNRDMNQFGSSSNLVYLGAAIALII
ncbi:hypothetical protein KDRO_E02650 [Kluyveromyces lactis]|nr:hypothetical protein KDRO_E02650 [Kluyveromyces lactis]